MPSGPNLAAPVMAAVVTLLVGMSDAAERSADQSPASGTLTLADGSRISGQLCPTRRAGIVAWQAVGFVEPFEFPLAAVDSLRVAAGESGEHAALPLVIELADGDLIAGQLVRWSGGEVTIETRHFGRIDLDERSVRRVIRIPEESELARASLTGIRDWRSQIWAADGWREDGTTLWSNAEGSQLVGDVGIPDRAIVEFELSWSELPEFVFSLATPRSDEGGARAVGWRLEVWGQTIVLVREVDDVADIAGLTGLDSEGGIHVVAYLDRIADRCHLYTPSGKLLGEVAPNRFGQAGSDPPNAQGGAVRLLCRKGRIGIKRLRVAPWNGTLPTEVDREGFLVTLNDGTTLTSSSVETTSRDAPFRLDGDDQSRSISVDEIARISQPAADAVNASNTAGEEAVRGDGGRGSTQAAADGEPDGANAAGRARAVLYDATRLTGSLERIEDDALVWKWDSAEKSLRIPLGELRVLSRSVGDRASAEASNGPAGRAGRLMLGDQTLHGTLAGVEKSDDASSDHASCLGWKPTASRNAARLRLDASGEVVYLPPRSQRVSRPTLPEAQGVIRFGGPFGGNRNPRTTAKSGPDVGQARSRERRGAHPHRVHFRSGDQIPCTVLGVGESHVRIDAAVSDAARLPAVNIKAIELLEFDSPLTLDSTKRERLLTVPRFQSASPPTHLLVSRFGDFLRCRLIEMDAETVRVELQLEEIQIPRDRVAQIIWFHEDEWKAAGDEGAEAAEETGDGAAASDPAAGGAGATEGDVDPAAADPSNGESESGGETGPDYVGMVQAIKADGDRMTFKPERVSNGRIFGASDVLGECRVAVSEIDRLLIGERIREASFELPFHRWRLQPAVRPLIARDSPELDSGRDSPLVGEAAPEIDLPLLGGERFQLSEQKGRIIVLDFWASWCAPCMQTMPLLEQAMGEFDSERVRLISVNLQERPGEIREVLERHELNLTVALDRDGVAAHRYQANAIPQLVVVDPAGKVCRLYVGGGSGVVEKLSATIREMLEASGDAS